MHESTMMLFITPKIIQSEVSKRTARFRTSLSECHRDMALTLVLRE